MMSTGTRTRKAARITANVLALVLLAVSARAITAPTVAHKAQESKRPKSPKNVLRAEPLRVTSEEKQTPASRLPATAESLNEGFVGYTLLEPLPPKAFTQLTRPDYLKAYSQGIPPVPLAPPA